MNQITEKHGLLSDYATAGTGSGFSLLHREEMVIDESWNKYRKYLNQPVKFALAWKKS